MSSKLNTSLLKLKLLDALRGGDTDKLSAVIGDLYSIESTTQTQDLIRLRETILHFAVQVAPLNTLEYIVQNAEKFHLDINSQDEDGNTPLHLAAMSSRLEIVKFLLSLPNINDTIVNRKKQQPVEICSHLEIIQVMQYERAKFVEQMAHKLREYFTKRDFNNLERILIMNPRASELLDINGSEPQTGNTVLHEFIKKDDVQMCEWILKHGGDPFKRDKRGKLPIDLVNSKNDALRKLIKDASRDQTIMDPVASTNHAHKVGCAPTYKGYLKKWTNFASGYKLRYFVLDQYGILSYYTNQDDTNNSCRGSLNLSFAFLHLDSSEKLKFEIIGKNGIRWHLKANHPTETNRWVWTLQNAITIAKDNLKKKYPGVQGSGGSQHIHTLLPEAERKKRNRLIPGRRKHMRNVSDISNISNASSVDDFAQGSTSSGFSKSTPSSPTAGIEPAGSFSLPRTDEHNSTRLPSMDNGSVLASEIENSDYDLEDEDYDSDSEAQEDLDNEDLGLGGPLGDQVFSGRRAIEIEILSLVELFETAIKAESNDKVEICEIGLRSLTNIKDQFFKYNEALMKRDKMLSYKLNRQLEVNRLWEQSIRQLENLISKRESQLSEYEDQKKSLRKLIEQGAVTSIPSHVESENPKLKSTNEVLESFLNENSDDEFFDADYFESNEESESNKNLSNEASESNANLTNEVSESNENISSEEVEEAVKPTEEGNNHAAESASQGSALEVRETSPETEGKKPSEMVVEAETFSESQEKALVKLNEEGSFLGYEDPVRTKLDMDSDDRPKVGLWGILKSMIGKDMTRMTLPVSFNECTSLLQRLAEDIEYSDLLDKAAAIDDSTLRMVYVAAFATSEYASTINRIAKPFNPLLGETFEYCRPDKKYRMITEQVSHNPPISVCWTESIYWDYYGENAVDSSFRGRSFDFKHLGKMFCAIRPHNKAKKPNGEIVEEELYSWQKVNTSVVGIMLGNPTVDNFGQMHIINHTTGDKMIVDMKQRGWRESSAYQVYGHSMDKDGKPRWALGGHWNSKLFAKKIVDNKVPVKRMSITEADLNSVSSDPSTNKKFLIWQAAPRPKVPFNLTAFAVTLNGLTPRLKPWLAPTDTRLRPDQKAMELGQYSLAADEKHRVEVKQRVARREREKKKEHFKPNWFVKKRHPITGDSYWEFKGNYWNLRKNKELEGCGDIF